jgi:hypothetical protein
MSTAGEDKQDDPGASSNSNWKDSYKMAQMVSLPDMAHVCGNAAGQLVKSLAAGVGCPEEYILMPLLTCCSGNPI